MVSQRVVLAIMSFFGSIVSIAMKACLLIAITEMVVPINNTKINRDSFICPAVLESTQSANITKSSATKYDWSQEQQGYILSAYFVGNIISHIPGGFLAEKYGGKWVLSLGILSATICNAITPQALNHGENHALILLIILRAMMGLGAGTMFPALFTLAAAWIPLKERGKLGSLFFTGGSIGHFLSTYLSGVILSYWSWPIVFYVWSSVALIWFIAFTIFCYNDPSSHPFITSKEREYLEIEIGQLKRHSDLPPTPWMDILISVPILVLIISSIASDWVQFMTDVPKYMKDVLGFTVHEIGLYTSIPYLLTWVVAITSGLLSDYMINHNYISVLNARKLLTGFSVFVPGFLLIGVSYAECKKVLVVVLFILSGGLHGTYYSSLKINGLDLSPNYSGSIIAIVNGSSSISGILAPIFIGYMTPDPTLYQWRFVFWVTFGIAVLEITVFSFWASADVQSWNEPKPKNKKQSEQLREH